MGRLAIYDGDSICKRNIQATALDDLRAGIEPSGGIFATLRAITAHARDGVYNINRMHFFFDLGVPQWRKDLLPDYKAKRKAQKAQMTDEQKELVYKQMDTIQEMLLLLGVGVTKIQGWEADDGVACMAVMTPDCLVVSGDKDLWQCATWGEGRRVLYLNDLRIVTRDNFEFVSGIPPAHYVLYRALVGDKSDGIAGAQGCGPVKAVKLIKELIEYTEGEPARIPEAQLATLVRMLLRKERNKVENEILRTHKGVLNTIRGTNLQYSASLYPNSEIIPATGKVDVPGFTEFCKRWKFRTLLLNIRQTTDFFSKT